jgi:hypothetical protein
MKTNILATAVALSDRDLLTRIDILAGQERESMAELVAHLAALEARPEAYAAQGYGSLFGYCTQALRLSEDAACTRIDAARACRRFPAILDLLASGSLTLTSIRLLGSHLTAENHQAVLARATNKTRREIEALVAELAPRPDVVASVRRLPIPKMTKPSSLPSASPTPQAPVASSMPVQALSVAPTSRPIVQASAPERYRVQFTMGPQTHEKFRRVQTLLRREIPDGDPGVIFDRALDLLLEEVEKAKLAAVARPQSGRVIRPGTDKKDAPPSRHIPAEVKRAVWRRDAGQCAFVSPAGRRCTERSFLELHHIQPHAQQGPATVGNISLRCRRHNQYEAALIFGPRGASTVGEPRAAFDPFVAG